MEDVNLSDDEVFFLFLNLSALPFREVCQHKTFTANWNKLDSLKKTVIYAISDVFTAVAFVDAKTPCYRAYQIGADCSDLTVLTFSPS